MATNDHGSYAGKVAFVTGAAGGIGRATALAFAREGANVVVSDISEQNVRETARMIEAAGGQALAIRCDVTRAEDVEAALETTSATFGRLDVAFNNAGVEQAKKALADITEEEWDRIIAIDLRGTFLCMKYEIPLLLQQGGGAIVNTSSGPGSRASKVKPPTSPPSTLWSASARRPPSTTRRRTSASTPSAPGSSTRR